MNTLRGFIVLNPYGKECSRNFLALTDDDGLAGLKQEGVNAYVIHYVSAQQQEFLFIGEAPWSS